MQIFIKHLNEIHYVDILVSSAQAGKLQGRTSIIGLSENVSNKSWLKKVVCKYIACLIHTDLALLACVKRSDKVY